MKKLIAWVCALCILLGCMMIPVGASSSNQDKIWEYFKNQGFSDAGVAGIMGNLEAESSYWPNNLEGLANTKSGFSDAQFTAAVDNGSISRAEFISSDRFGVCKSPIGKEYGYGLAQWTYTTRKAALYDYAKSRGVSIGDLNMQLDFMMREMSASLKSYLRTATDVSDACVRFHNIYEGSADTESMIAGRVAKAKNVYNKYASLHNGNNLSTVSISDGVYVLESKLDSSKAIDVYAGSKDSEANLELWTKNEKLNQKFKIERDGDTYKISAYHSGLSMDVDEASPASGTNIQQYRFWGENNPAQKWIFQDAGDGYVYIRSMLGTYVDVCGGSRNDGTNIWAYNFNGSDAQKWRLVPTSTVSISDGLYVLESKLDSSKAIDVYAGSMNSEANLELWTKNEKNNQKFKIEKDGSTYKITAYHSGLSMDVDEASPASGTNIQQYRFWGENNLAQKWVLQDAGNGYVYIRSMLGTCVDVYDGARADGTNIWAYNFNGTDAQKWKLVPTSCAHTYGNWSVTKSTSCTESGTETRVCSLCQKTETRTINALGHSYSNGVCSKCGERENTNTPVTPNPPVSPDSGKKEVHFPKITIYFQGQFSDVPTDQWFTNNVANAFSLGLMKGNSATTFNPYGDVTIAEAVAMAARIHSIYTTGSENFTQGTPWYQCYLDYAYQNKIISYAYYNCDVKNKATRAQFAEIFAAALPDEALSIKNSVSDNAVPDVKMKDSYSAPVYKLYRAGILAGGDAKGTFSPGTFITRAECATIVARMADSDNRVSFSLT